MAIKLEKILTVDFKTYCEMVGKKPSDFIPYGIHWAQFANNLGEEYMREFAEKVPDEAEVVVDYKLDVKQYKYLEYFQTGLALIPKSPKKRKLESKIHPKFPCFWAL